MDTPAIDSPFHAGEQAMQTRTGVRERIEAFGRAALRDHMPDQHRELFAKLPTFLLGVQDAGGQPWATMLAGAPGFVSTPDACTLRIAARPAAGDPTAALLTPGASVGMLGLEPHTRRRNRVNGRVRAVDEAGFEVEVLQSFGNCPKYIHGRRSEPLARTAAPAMALGPELHEASQALLQRADTLFIASASGQRAAGGRSEGVDVSHRGGRPGFIEVGHGPAGLRLTLPDYPGNFLFNTLGNLMQWPRAGVLVIDYASGDLLQLAADATIAHELDAQALARWPGARRLLHLDVRSAWWRAAALPLRWTAPEAPPQFAVSEGASAGY